MVITPCTVHSHKHKHTHALKHAHKYMHIQFSEGSFSFTIEIQTCTTIFLLLDFPQHNHYFTSNPIQSNRNEITYGFCATCVFFTAFLLILMQKHLLSTKILFTLFRNHFPSCSHSFHRHYSILSIKLSGIYGYRYFSPINFNAAIPKHDFNNTEKNYSFVKRNRKHKKMKLLWNFN